MASETEWRRRWKPTLIACPWQSIDVDGENLLIKMKFYQSSYEILMTDLTSFWFEALDEKELKQRMEKLNPNIEAPLTNLLDQIKQSIEKPTKGTKLAVNFKNLSEDGRQKLTLTVTTILAGMPFQWKFHANPADTSIARDHLTFPLLLMVSELTRRQQELFTLLACKDKEIEDYKSQGVRPSRKHMETPKFDTIAFKNTMATSKGFEEQVRKMETTFAFSAEGKELYSQITTKHAWLRCEALGGNSDEELAEEESVPISNQGGDTKQSWANRLPPSLAAPKGTVSPIKTPTASPAKSPAKSPGSDGAISDTSPSKIVEKQRRELLEKKLEQEEHKKQEKKIKKKFAL